MRMAMVTVHTFQFFYDHPVVIICGTDLLEFGPQSYDQQTDSPDHGQCLVVNDRNGIRRK